MRPLRPPGDNIHTARHIARECGILTEGGVAMEGPEFRQLNELELQELLPNLQVRRAGYSQSSLSFLPRVCMRGTPPWGPYGAGAPTTTPPLHSHPFALPPAGAGAVQPARQSSAGAGP